MPNGCEQYPPKSSRTSPSANNVTVLEIETVLKQLKQRGHDVTSRDATHGKLFRVDNQRFMICHHNPGGKQLKRCYVKVFLRAMVELELHDEE